MPENTPKPTQSSNVTVSGPEIPEVRKPHSSHNLIPVVVILAVLVLAGIGVSIFFGIQNSAKLVEIDDLKAQLSDKDPIVIIDEPISSDDPDENPQPTIITKADVLAEVPSYLSLVDKAPLNAVDQTHILTDSVTKENFGGLPTRPIEVQLNLSDGSIYLVLDWDAIADMYPASNISRTGTQTYTDIHLAGRPTDFLISGFGQAVGEETIFFLMEDGTVEYIPLVKAFREDRIESYGKLPGIENVIKFYNVGSCEKNGQIGCGHNILAQRADGKYYSLFTAIQDTGNYQF